HCDERYGAPFRQNRRYGVRSVIRRVMCHPLQEKLLSQVQGHQSAEVEHHASSQQTDLRPFTRVVNLRKFRRSNCSNHTGIGRLPLTIVSLRTKRRLDRIPGPVRFCPPSAVEVSRILMKNRGGERRRNQKVARGG